MIKYLLYIFLILFKAQGRQAELLEVIKAKEKEITLLTEQIKNTKREADDQKTSLSMEVTFYFKISLCLVLSSR